MSEEDTDSNIEPLADNESIANRVKLLRSPTKGATSISAKSPDTLTTAQRVRQFAVPIQSKVITDYFSKKRGRKRKKIKSKVKKGVTNVTEVDSLDDNSYVCSSSDAEFDEEILDTKQPAPQINDGTERIHRISWQTKENFPILVETIKEKRRLGKQFQNGPSTASGLFVPRTTLNTMLQKLGGKEPTYENCFPIQKNHS